MAINEFVFDCDSILYYLSLSIESGWSFRFLFRCVFFFLFTSEFTVIFHSYTGTRSTLYFSRFNLCNFFVRFFLLSANRKWTETLDERETNERLKQMYERKQVRRRRRKKRSAQWFTHNECIKLKEGRNGGTKETRKKTRMNLSKLNVPIVLESDIFRLAR